MHHLNSYFILEQFERGLQHGRFSAVTLFLDISGFTHTTETLMTHGQQGAELLANIISNIFDPLVQFVYQHGGDITHFAGDAFQVIFPISGTAEKETVLAHALAAAQSMQTRMSAKATFPTAYGTFQFTAKIGLSLGDLEWGIIAGPSQHIYYFRGTAVDECATAENLGQGGQIILHRRLYEQIQSWVTAVPVLDNDTYLCVTAVQKQVALQRTKTSPPISAHTPTFTPKSLLNSNIQAEFRYTCNLFLNVKEVQTHTEITTFMQTFFATIAPYDGYVNRLAFGDKGCHLLIFWGAPISHENDISRALNFALELQKNSPVPIRMGITYGLSHAGFVGAPLREEYTCYGHQVNLAAHIMTQTDWGDIWLGERLLQHTQNEFTIARFGNIALKGVANLQPVYRLEGHQQEIQQSQYSRRMVGRETELQQLQTALAPIFKGTFAGIITVYGEAGIGKSRLIYELRQQLPTQMHAAISADLPQEVRWLYGPVDEILRQPLNPFRYWLRHYFQQSRVQTTEENKILFQQTLETLAAKLTDKAVINELTRTFSILGALLDLYWPDSLYEKLEPRLRAENKQLAFINLIKAETLLHPVILEIEDGHWLDNASKDLIGALTRNLAQHPLAILLTNRYQDDGSGFALPVDTAVPQQEIHLHYLPITGIQHLAEQIIAGTISPTILHFLMEKTNGNPFFAEQLLLNLKEQGHIQPESANSTLYNFRTDFQLDDVPVNLRAVLIARLDRLIDETRQIVQMAAVLGQEFDIGVLKAMAVEFDDLNEFITQGESEQIWSAISKIIYAFKHALMRDAAYGMQLQAHLKHLHAFAALAYEALYADNLSEYYANLAYHYEQAEIEEKAIEYLKLAGDAAKNSYQNNIALNFYDRLLKYNLDDQTKIEILSAQGDIYYIQGNWQPAIPKLNHGIVLSKTISSVEKETNLRIQLGTILCDMGKYDEAIDTLEKALVLASNYSNEHLLAKILTVKSRTHLYIGDNESALCIIKESLQLNQKLGDKFGTAMALSGIGGTYGMTHRYKKSLACFQDAILIFEELDEQVEISRPIHNAGLAHYFLGNFNEAVSFFQKAVFQSEKIGDRVSTLSAFHRLGQLYHAEKQIDQAIVYFEKSTIISQELGDSGLPSATEPYLAWAYFSEGKYDKSIKTIINHFKNIQKQNRDVEHGLAHMVLALILMETESNNIILEKTAYETLEKIEYITNLTLAPANYFLHAIDGSREKNYLETLIPSLMYYGGYLLNKYPSYRREEGLSLLAEANDLAILHDMGWNQKDIISYCASLNLSINELK